MSRLDDILMYHMLQIRYERRYHRRRRKELAQERLSRTLAQARAWYAPGGTEGLVARQARRWLAGRFVPFKWRRYPLAYAFVAMPAECNRGMWPGPHS